jgi:hypothetical protein
LPSKELADKVISDLEEAVMFDVTLTDGEPIREENRDVLVSFARVSEKYPLSIITNAKFAESLRKSEKWFKFLKENGWDINRDGNHLAVSSGLMYGVSWKNYACLARGLHEFFPEARLGEHLFFKYFSSGDINKKESNLLNNICSAMYTAFQEKGHPKITTDENVPSFRFVAHVDFGEGFDFRIDVRDYDPAGRGLDEKTMQAFPIKNYEVKSMGFSPDTLGAIVVASNGDVSFGNSLSCFASGRNYGNVMNETLKVIKKRIYTDPIYQSFRLGGVRFMCFLAQNRDPNLIFTGRQRCDVCTHLFGDISLLNSIRKSFEQRGVVETYKRYLDVVGIPNIG